MLSNLFHRHEHIQTKFESLYSLPNEKLYKYVIQPLRKQAKENKHIQSSSFKKASSESNQIFNHPT